jgi:hypothetical protein
MRLTEKELRVIFAKRPGELTVDDLNSLRPDHVARLSPRHVAALTTAQLLAMPAKHLAKLTQEQVAVLSLAQMGLVPASRRRRKASQRFRVKVEPEKVEPVAELAKLADSLRWRLVVIFLLVLPLVHLWHIFTAKP